jgi:hypothetical protein
MDWSQLSTPDLLAIQAGDLTKVSDAGLKMLHAQSQPQVKAPPPILGGDPGFEDPGMLKSGLIGAGRTTDRIIKGVKQAYYTATSPWIPENDQKLSDLKQQADQENKAYAPLTAAHPFATGVGEAVPSMVVPAGGASTLIGNAVRMGVAGALPGALEYGSPEERGRRAMWGAAAGASVPLAVSGVKAVKAAIEPTYEAGQNAILSRLLNRTAGEDAPNVISKLESSSPLVPGSIPTAAQVAENGGINALERSAAAVNPAAYSARAMQQAEARAAALRGIAQTPEALQAAVEARKNITGALYNAATSGQVSVTPELTSALDRLPDAVWSKASKLSKLDTGAPIDKAADTIGGKTLHYLKLALDDTISTGPQVGMGSVERGLMTDAKGNLLGQMDANLPGYQAARTTYAQMSEPINQMQVGQAFYNKMVPALRDVGARTGETASSYAAALRNSEPLVQSATGMSGKSLADVMTSNQLGTLEAVGKDLARKANAENIGRGVGSDTVQKLAMSNLIDQAGFGKLGEKALEIPAINSVVQMIYPSANQEMQQKLAKVLLDPNATADLMRRTSPKVFSDNPRLRQAMSQLLLRPGLAIAPVAANVAQQP